MKPRVHDLWSSTLNALWEKRLPLAVVYVVTLVGVILFFEASLIPWLVRQTRALMLILPQVWEVARVMLVMAGSTYMLWMGLVSIFKDPL